MIDKDIEYIDDLLIEIEDTMHGELTDMATEARRRLRFIAERCKTYYAIWDNDLNKYLCTGCNRTNKRKTLEDYMYYREPDLGNWEEEFDTFKDYLASLTDEDILEDIAACNFELHSSNKPFECCN